MNKHRVLVLGASGMLGHMLFKILSADTSLEVSGTVRRLADTPVLEKFVKGRIFENIHFFNDDPLIAVLDSFKPNVIINCVGLIKQRSEGNDSLSCIEYNSRLPHRIAKIASAVNSRFIHISTDCVFDGSAGNYTEENKPTAYDIYGLSKYLGEVTEGKALTLRTSIIGPELRGKLSLLEWFLSQNSSINGYDKVIYSGLPTIELSLIIKSIIKEFPDLKGLYHVGSDPISKYDLLRIIAKVYQKNILIQKDSHYKSDKSLVYSKFSKATGYTPKPWHKLIEDMYAYDTIRGKNYGI